MTALSEQEQTLILAYRQGLLGPTPPGMMAPVVTPRPPGILRLILGGIGAMIGLLLVILLVLLLLTTLNFVTATGQTFASVGERATIALDQTGKALGGLLQNLADRADPTHPPREPLVLDTEFQELRVLRAGDALGETDEYVLHVEAIRRREGADTPDIAQYAVIKRQYRTPRETKILGLTVHTDRGEAEHYLDKGESFRIGRALYKINWISAADEQVAIARYRTPDRITAPLEFAYD